MPLDADADGVGRPDPHGHAALLIVESLIHVLIAKDLLTFTEAAEVVEIAADVTIDMENSDELHSADLRKSLGLISQIGISLRRGGFAS